MRFLAASAVLGLLLAGCGDDGDSAATQPTTVTETTTVATTQPPTTTLEARKLAVFFLRAGKVEATAREVVSGPAVARAATTELLEGPGHADALTTAIPDGTELRDISVDAAVARVDLSRPLDRAGLAQLVYTLTQFPTVRRVSVGGARPLGRAAFEQQTPAILVLSPLPRDEVESGFEVRGTANTFEATFEWELLDANDHVIAKNFETATSGNGTRGTFDFTVRYDVPKPQDGTLVVFEISAEDGSRTHERRVPLSLR